MFFRQSVIGYSILVCIGIATFLMIFLSHLKESQLQPLQLNYESEKNGSQKRYWVSKEFLFSNSVEDRMALKMRGREANIQFVAFKNKNKLIEEMSGLKGVFQEKFYYLLPDGTEIFLNGSSKWVDRKGLDRKSDISHALPMQTICFFEAKCAHFQNNSGQIIVQGVAIQRMQNCGHTIPEKINEKNRGFFGLCDRLQFNLLDKKPSFSAEGFHSSLYTKL